MLPGVKQPQLFVNREDADADEGHGQFRWFTRLAALVFIVGALTLVALKPVGIFGTNAESLASSLASHVGNASGEVECRQTGPWEHRCHVSAASGGGVAVVYRLSEGSNGCWTAQTVGRLAEVPPVQSAVSGCVGLVDVLRAIP